MRRPGELCPHLRRSSDATESITIDQSHFQAHGRLSRRQRPAVPFEPLYHFPAPHARAFYPVSQFHIFQVSGLAPPSSVPRPPSSIRARSSVLHPRPVLRPPSSIRARSSVLRPRPVLRPPSSIRARSSVLHPRPVLRPPSSVLRPRSAPGPPSSFARRLIHEHSRQRRV